VRPALLDNSAWARMCSPTRVPSGRRTELADSITAGEIFVCLPFMLEAGYSARNALAHDELLCELLALPWAAIDATVEERALEAQAQLARVGHHRLPPVDLLIAAIAERHRLGVLHYDADYDIIADRTDLSFESVWLADRGTLWARRETGTA